jgi:hypothetical protein
VARAATPASMPRAARRGCGGRGGGADRGGEAGGAASAAGLLPRGPRRRPPHRRRDRGDLFPRHCGGRGAGCGRRAGRAPSIAMPRHHLRAPRGPIAARRGATHHLSLGLGGLAHHDAGHAAAGRDLGLGHNLLLGEEGHGCCCLGWLLGGRAGRGWGCGAAGAGPKAGADAARPLSSRSARGPPAPGGPAGGAAARRMGARQRAGTRGGGGGAAIAARAAPPRPLHPALDPGPTPPPPIQPAGPGPGAARFQTPGAPRGYW